MLTAEEVKPFLLHADRYVRETASEYLHLSFDEDPQLLPMVLKACRRYGFSQNISVLSQSRRFVVTEASLREALALLEECDNGDAITELVDIIAANTPVELLGEVEPLARSNGHRLSLLRDCIERRLTFANWTAPQLWEELQAFARYCEEPNAKLDFDDATALVEVLARCDFPPADEVSRLLASKEIEGGWFEIALVDLAGRRRLTATIPQLVERFHIDTDLLLEHCVEALARMPSAQTVQLVRGAFPQADLAYRIYTSDLLGSIHLPEAEDAILAVLESEKDVAVRTLLCLALCRQISQRGIPIVEAQIRDGYDRVGVCLEDELLAVADMLGIDLPNGPRWRQQREQRRRDREARLAALLRGAPYPAGRTPSQPRMIPDEPPEFLPPIHRAAPKSGRNDPCPCGSGQKYKRCCGRS